MTDAQLPTPTPAPRSALQDVLAGWPSSRDRAAVLGSLFTTAAEALGLTREAALIVAIDGYGHQAELLDARSFLGSEARVAQWAEDLVDPSEVRTWGGEDPAAADLTPKRISRRRSLAQRSLEGVLHGMLEALPPTDDKPAALGSLFTAVTHALGLTREDALIAALDTYACRRQMPVELLGAGLYLHGKTLVARIAA